MATLDGFNVDTAEIAVGASRIENINKQLCDQLQRSKDTIAKLGEEWQGEAYNATKQSFDNFYNKFYSVYKEMIDEYIKFLRQQVDAQGVSTESSVQKIAEMYNMG